LRSSLETFLRVEVFVWFCPGVKDFSLEVFDFWLFLIFDLFLASRIF